MVANTVEKSRVVESLQILVVDDSSEITSLVGEVLVDAGASFVPANSGTAAIALIMLMKFDLVILDLGMPLPDGLMVIEFLKAANPALLRRVLVLTGNTCDMEAMGILKALHIPCLLKPFHLDDLLEAVARLSLPESVTIPAA